MKFKLIDKKPVCSSFLVYRKDEFSFDTEPDPEPSFSTILFDDLGIELDEQGLVQSIGGFCPYPSWMPAKLAFPNFEKCKIKVILKDRLEAGISYRYNDAPWPVYFDQHSSIVCIGDPLVISKAIMFASDAVMVLTHDKPVSLWLRFKFV